MRLVLSAQAVFMCGQGKEEGRAVAGQQQELSQVLVHHFASIS